MYLSSSQTAVLGQVLDTLTQSLEADEIRMRLGTSLTALLGADHFASYVWDENTQRFGRGLGGSADSTQLRRYEQDFQFRDPITQRLRDRRYPTLVTQVMPQRELVRTEFFNDFLNSDGLYWGLNFYVHDGNTDLGDVRIWRARGKHNFDTQEIELVRMLYPAIVNALRRSCNAASSRACPEGVEEMLMRMQRLTQREAQVASLAAQGCPDKEIARRIGIGFTTVRSHLTNVFRKTGYSDRKNLIHGIARLTKPQN